MDIGTSIVLSLSPSFSGHIFTALSLHRMLSSHDALILKVFTIFGMVQAARKIETENVGGMWV